MCSSSYLFGGPWLRRCLLLVHNDSTKLSRACPFELLAEFPPHIKSYTIFYTPHEAAISDRRHFLGVDRGCQIVVSEQRSDDRAGQIMKLHTISTNNATRQTSSVREIYLLVSSVDNCVCTVAGCGRRRRETWSGKWVLLQSYRGRYCVVVFNSPQRCVCSVQNATERIA